MSVDFFGFLWTFVKIAEADLLKPKRGVENEARDVAIWEESPSSKRT